MDDFDFEAFVKTLKQFATKNSISPKQMHLIHTEWNKHQPTGLTTVELIEALHELNLVRILAIDMFMSMCPESDTKMIYVP